MKRVTILVDDIGEPDRDGERLVVGTRDAGNRTYIAADRVLSVEDHVEPLPTEPGARFSIDISPRYLVIGAYVDRGLRILRLYPLPLVRLTLEWSNKKS